MGFSPFTCGLVSTGISNFSTEAGSYAMPTVYFPIYVDTRIGGYVIAMAFSQQPQGYDWVENRRYLYFMQSDYTGFLQFSVSFGSHEATLPIYTAVS